MTGKIHNNAGKVLVNNPNLIFFSVLTKFYFYDFENKSVWSVNH